MAQFKLYLLTPSNSSAYGIVKFLKTPISEFYGQEIKTELIEQASENNLFKTKSNFCYSFNEKLSLHSNGQKDFNFSMLRKIWLGDEWTTNPFIAQLHNGTQLLLQDKYDNQMFFTIKNISYKLGSTNITYDVSCQDSFTYQAIRQNSGYTIENQSDSGDFIGAKDVDWWAVNKIKPECHLAYDYIPLFQGLFLDEENKIKVFTKDSDLKRVKKIIKKIYTKNEHPEYYETIPFSVSGSNCSAALISLAEEVGLSLNYVEHEISDHHFKRYFWFEPKKNEDVSNLKYSPHSSIQSFGFTQSGDSLTTVLNIESNTVDDEIVSLIPEIPLFFQKLIQKNDWKISKFSAGYFSSICQEEVFVIENGISLDNVSHKMADNNPNEESRDIRFDKTTNSLYIKLLGAEGGSFKLPSHYSLIDFQTQNKSSYLYMEGSTVRLTPLSSDWSFIEKVEKDGEVIEIEYNNTFNPIPENKLGKNINAWIKIRYEVEEGFNFTSLTLSNIVLRFYREPLEEDLEFAKIADACPWLENKLIDFYYFLEQGLINKSEYSEIMDIVTNDLRITNGLLMVYSAQYYQAIHQKTQILANLVSDLDSLGAAYQADVINSFTNNGSVKDLSYFRRSYDYVESRYFKNSNIQELMNYEELLTEYLNKYFNSQQRFLKNIYNFCDYFNSFATTQDEKVYRHIITFTKPSDIDDEYSGFRDYLSFTAANYVSVDENFNLYDPDTYKPFTSIYKSDTHDLIEVAHAENVLSLYKPNIKAGDMIPATSYNNKKTYYRIAYKILVDDLKELGDVSSILVTVSIAEKQEQFYLTQIRTDGKYAYYGFSDTNENMLKHFNDQNITIDTLSTKEAKYEGKILSFIYDPVPYSEILSEFMYRKAKEEGIHLSKDQPISLSEESIGINKWYTHTKDTYEPVSSWLGNDLSSTSDSMANALNSFSNGVWYNFVTTEELDLVEWKDLFSDGDVGTKIRKKLYVEKFPITSITWKGPKYIESSFEWTREIAQKYSTTCDYNITSRYQRVNKRNQSVMDYIDYWTRTKNGETLSEIKNPTEYEETFSIPLVTKSNEANFYRRVVKAPGWIYAAGVASVVLGSIFGGLVYALVSDALWENATVHWDTTGHNTKDWKNQNLLNRYSGYVAYPQREEKNKLTLNYATSPDAYDRYNEIQKEYKKNFIDKLEEKKIDTLSSTSEQPITYINREISNYNTNYIVSKVKDQNLCLINKISTSNPTEDRKTYDGYYKWVGLTYFNAKVQNDSNLTYKESYLRPLHCNDYINKSFKYGILVQKNLNQNSLVFKNDSFDISSWCDNGQEDRRIWKNKYYPLSSCLVDLDFSVFGKDFTNSTLKAALEKAGYKEVTESNQNFWIESQLNGAKIRFMVFQIEDFKRERVVCFNDFSENYLKANKRFKLYSGSTIYDKNKALEVNLSQYEGLVQGFFEVADKDSAFSRITKMPAPIETVEQVEPVEEAESTTPPLETWENIDFYKKLENDEYEKVYSIPQITKMKQYSYLKSDSFTYENFEQESDIFAKVYLHHEEYENGKLVSTTIKELDESIEFSHKNTIITVSHDNISYSQTYQITTSEIHNIGEMTNGTFWHLFCKRTDMPELQKRAAMIETQLTQYWMTAYSASKYCEYFIPENWTTENNGGKNYFGASIIKVNKNNEVSLSDSFIPQVKIYFDGRTTRLPRYNIKYGTVKANTNDTTLSQINPTQYKNGASIIKNNIAFKNLLYNLGENAEGICFEEISSSSSLTKTSYYYSEIGGVKWKDVLSKISIHAPEFINFDGLYIMTYKILKSCFVNKNLDEYEYYKNKHDNIWNNLYSKFPGIILENIYKNTAATTASDLYTLSKNAFKDLSYPEKGYNISLIDIKGLQGYSGQEIKVGDGILINTEEFYDEADIIGKGLSQYLFITDISYDLRKDSDISLTVNNIKYQDKLIQRLVKLIR